MTSSWRTILHMRRCPCVFVWVPQCVCVRGVCLCACMRACLRACVCVCASCVCVCVGYIYKLCCVCVGYIVFDFSTFIDGWQEVARELEEKTTASLRADEEVSLDPSFSTRLWRKDGAQGTRRILPVPCRLPMHLLLSQKICILAWEYVRYTHTRTNRLICICIWIRTYVYLYIHVIYMCIGIYI